MENLVIWPGLLAGLAIGLYMIAQYWISSNQLGCSLAYGNLCGFVSRKSYFQRGEFADLNNWRLWFIIGIPLGGFLAALTSPEYELSLHFSLGEYYDSIYPENLYAKTLLLFLGGIFMGFGARLAGGCTSGHAVAGVALMNPPSLLAATLFFISGLATVQGLFALGGAA